VRRGCDLRRIIEELLQYYDFNPKPEDFLAIKAVKEGMHPFGVLVSIILTQNTSDRNALKALDRLRKNVSFDLNPASLTRVSVEQLADLIKPSGMQLVKARTIKKALEALSMEELNNLMSLDPELLRQKLMSVKGIGHKTIDVFLLMLRDYPTFPIDTHIRRVLTRLGCIKANERYEIIREEVINELGKDPNTLCKAHIILIIHGREICKARDPRCLSCPLRNVCKFYTSKRM